MFKYQKFLIRENDEFSPDQFPKLYEELDSFNLHFAAKSSDIKKAMLLTFLKDDEAKTHTNALYPELAEQIQSKKIKLETLEALYGCSNNNSAFRKQLEEYIFSGFTEVAGFFGK